jgi:hypothetical protein
MIFTSEGLAMTRVMGVCAYTAALAACIWRWWRSGQSRRGDAVFGVLAVVQLALLLDMIFNLRWKLHEFFMDEAMAHGVYGLRRQPQLVAMVLLTGATVICCGWLVSRLQRRPGAAIAVVGTLLSVGLRCAEVLSYHNLDAVLYFTIGKMMMVSILWIGLTGLTCVGAWMDGRSRN